MNGYGSGLTRVSGGKLPALLVDTQRTAGVTGEKVSPPAKRSATEGASSGRRGPSGENVAEQSTCHGLRVTSADVKVVGKAQSDQQIQLMQFQKLLELHGDMFGEGKAEKH